MIDDASRTSRNCFFFFQAEDGIRDYKVTGVQTCALPIFAVLYPVPTLNRRFAGDGHFAGPAFGIDPFRIESRVPIKDFLRVEPKMSIPITVDRKSVV